MKNLEPHANDLDRAIRLLMERGGIDEHQARSRLQEAADRHGVTIAYVANSILDNDGVQTKGRRRPTDC